ncbi:MAG: HNH endonuclease, partial [Candidatus Heimdallarchaeota archaeon]
MPSEDPEYINDYQKQYWKEYGQKNRQKLNEKEKLRRKRIKDWLKSYKNDLSCSQCPETENHCLDFHHVRDKKFTINYMINNSYSISRIEEEIEKCIVLCGNCHR